MAITLEQVNPTVFNFLSDVVSLLIRVGFGIAIAQLYIILMSWHLKTGRKIPVGELGTVPDNFFASAKLTSALQFSLPSLILLLFLVAADFSHSLADLGLSFVTVQMKGPRDTVLSLKTSDRNPMRLIQTAGDPLHIQTFPVPVTGFQDAQGNVSTEALQQARKQNALMSSFMDAVEIIARGGSPFVQQTDFTNVTRTRVNWGGAPNVQIFYHDDGSFLSQISLEIPIDCFNSEMEEIDFGFFSLSELDTMWTSLVPNCTFTGPRLSGIYGNSPGTATIIEQAETIGAFFEDQVFLKTDTDGLVQDFIATPEMKELASFREDWRRGRYVPGIRGLKIGEFDIDFGAVVLATGVEENAEVSPEIEWNRYNEYGLIGEILGECPPRPSGLSMSNLSCMAILTLSCESFQEDFQLIAPSFASLGLNDPTNSTCRLNSVDIVWGQGFDPDAELVAVVSGIYGRVRPNQFNGRAQDNFMINSIFAAMFAVATLDVRPSNIEVVRPRIGVFYITFTVLPLALTVIILVVFAKARHTGLPIPRSTWESMVLGREEEKVPTRNTTLEKFPPKEKAHSLALSLVENGGCRKLGIEDDPKRLHSRRVSIFHRLSRNALSSSVEEEDEDREDDCANDAVSSLESDHSKDGIFVGGSILSV